MRTRSRFPAAAAAGVAAASLALVGLAPAAAEEPDEPHTLVPIGGGYEPVTLEMFGKHVADQADPAEQADGDTVDILVVPSAYGDDPDDRQDNIGQAQVRTDQIDAACDRVVAVQFADTFTGCTATLLMLFDRQEAMDPANSLAFADPETDGAYVLGGDQVLAMEILANSPAETVMTQAAGRGVVFGGTSAGNAVESRTMLAGYAGPGWPWNALERGMALVFWGDDLATEERGLAFGSDRVIFDQHFYERGRFGRLLAITAQSVERYGGPGKLGVGVDWATGIVAENDTTLGEVFGYSSTTLFDFTTATIPQWVGPRQTLSVRDVLTHVMPEGDMTYDVPGRTPYLDGAAVPTPGAQPLPDLPRLGSGSVLLGGGQNATADSPVLHRLVSLAGSGPIVVVAAGYPDTAAARAEAQTYAAALAGAGWSGEVQVRVQGVDTVGPAQLRRAAAVVFLGGDQALMGAALADKQFTQAVRVSLSRPTPVLTDGAMTAVLGDWYAAEPDPTSRTASSQAIDAFQVDGVSVERGLGLVDGFALQPTLTYDYHWGRLYNAAMQHPDTISLGISELTALEVRRGDASVVGERSVIAVDGRAATWFAGDNGALGAVNVSLDAFAPGDTVE